MTSVGNFLTQAYNSLTSTIASVFNSGYQFIASIRLPQISLPRITFPHLAISLPKITLPTIAIKLPNITLPQVKFPTFAINLPKVNLPKVTLPTIKPVETPKVAIVMPEVDMKPMQEATQKIQDDYERERQSLIKRMGEAVVLTLAELRKPVVEANNFFAKAKIAYDTAYAIMFDKEPTRISEVTIVEIGEDYAIITFKTNHPAWGKVNYGDSTSYGQEVLLKECEYLHTAKLTGLEKGKHYYFEVMAQNKNYAYDAYYTFETKK